MSVDSKDLPAKDIFNQACFTPELILDVLFLAVK
jgi:hypothetical protein